jgi:hypothetical protein
MKVKIVGCSDSRYWYANRIGWVYQVVRIDTDRVWVREDNKFAALNFILDSDFESEKYG